MIIKLLYKNETAMVLINRHWDLWNYDDDKYKHLLQ